MMRPWQELCTWQPVQIVSLPFISGVKLNTLPHNEKLKTPQTKSSQ